jgi:hypothetical protein
MMNNTCLSRSNRYCPYRAKNVFRLFFSTELLPRWGVSFIEESTEVGSQVATPMGHFSCQLNKNELKFQRAVELFSQIILD